MNKNETKIIRYIKWPLILMVIFFVFLVLFSVSYLFFLNKYENKIFPGINIGGINIGGLTVVEAKEIIDKKINQINQEGISLKYQGAEINLTPQISSLSGDISYEVIQFDAQSSVNSAYLQGRDGSFFVNLGNQISNLTKGKELALKNTLDEDEIKKIIHNNFEQFEIESQNARLIIASSTEEEKIDFSIQKEEMGKVVDYDKALEDIKKNINTLSSDDVLLKDKLEYPTIHQRDCLNIESQINNILKEIPVKLKYQDNTWQIEKEDIIKWLELNKNGVEVIVDLSNQNIKKFLEEEVAPEINKEPIDARFEIEEEKVTQFESSQDGIEMEIDRTLEKIKNTISGETATKTVSIETKEIKSKINVDNINDLGIKEIIGTGHSSFSGSPANRIHNITVGSQKLNGLLIKPGEEFSLVTSLGDIDAENGYKTELVIKGNKTVPEYGGGLCQVATTMFRTAINTGLKITERSSHSYRVSYYEPAGTDATIYVPKPDLMFVNDTPSYILIQYRIEGSDLFFDFWGTNDGRKVTSTDPVIYNITNPAPTKIIETTDLAPGQRKCTESAHKGAEAYFDYIVEYKDGEKRERRFYSKYSPWRAVCLEGVEKLTTEEDENNNDADADNKNESATNNEESLKENTNQNTDIEN